MYPLKYRPSRLAEIGRKNRREIVQAGVTRRELIKLGLLSSSGALIPMRGLNAQSACEAGACQPGCSPPTERFVDPLPIPAVLPERPLSDPGFQIPPGAQPSGHPQDARTETHQFRERFPPQKFFISRMRPNPAFRFSEHPANLARIPAGRRPPTSRQPRGRPS